MTAFTLDTTPGARRLTIAGRDVTDYATGCTLVVGDVTEPAVLHVEIASAESVIDGDAVVHFYHPPTDDQIERAAEFLASLDPAQVEALAAAKFTTIGQSPYSLVLEVLAEMVEAMR